MGLRGAHARKPKPNAAQPIRSAWLKKHTRVDRVIAFLESLPITKGIYAGRKMRLLPGQRRFIETIYGKISRDGRRQIRLAIKSEPRGNGKTGLLAGLALAHLLGPESEVRGEIYSAAYNKLQAALIFAEMQAIILAVPEFDARSNLQRYGKVIEVMKGDGAGSVYESLSADDKRAHGLSPSFWVYDEFAQAPNADLLNNLRTSMGKRRESLGVVISTQAATDLHPLSQLIDDAALGEDSSVYLQLAAAPTEADIFDEKVWFGCNEALGKFLDLNEFRTSAAQAKRLPSFRSRFENLRLNRRVDMHLQFISDADWMACAQPLDMASLSGELVMQGSTCHRPRTCRRWCCIGPTMALCCRTSGCPPKVCSTATARKAGTIELGAILACSRRRRDERSTTKRSSSALPRLGWNTISSALPMTVHSSKHSTCGAKNWA
jgi:phage terminase large subunit-like protein